MHSIARSFDRAFPRAQFVLVLGNEDSDCGDYRGPIGNAFLRMTARAWEPLVNRNGAAPTFARTFAEDGSYSARLPSGMGRAVVINDVFWSLRPSGGCGASYDAPERTVERLATLLPRSPAEHAIVFAHIPPGIDTYSSSYLTHGLVTVPNLRPDMNDRYLSLLADPERRVSLAIAGHAHRFGFRVARARTGGSGVPIVVAPAISPVYQNSPSFLVARIDADATIRSLEEWARNEDPTIVDRSVWANRGGTRALGMADVPTASILALQRRLDADPALLDAFGRLAVGSTFSQITPRNRRLYLCAATELTIAAFRACTRNGGFGYLTRRGLLAAIAGLAAFVAISVLAVRWVRQARTKRASGA